MKIFWMYIFIYGKYKYLLLVKKICNNEVKCFFKFVPINNKLKYSLLLNPFFG